MSESTGKTAVRERENSDFLDPSRLRFTQTEGGYLALSLDGAEPIRVRPAAALPYREPERYLSFLDSESGSEIGMLEELSDLSADQREIVRDELKKIYFVPTVTAIRSAKQRAGFWEFRVSTEFGERSFRLRDPMTSVFRPDPDLPSVRITDADGNRWAIPDPAALDRKSYRKIAGFLN